MRMEFQPLDTSPIDNREPALTAGHGAFLPTAEAVLFSMSRAIKDGVRGWIDVAATAIEEQAHRRREEESR